jgi:hypothetical protein
MAMNRLRTQEYLVPKDPLILENLIALQDISSPEKALLPCQEDNIAHTFSNCLVAMAFMLEGERKRAERILDFFAEAMDENNADPYLQNFYFQGQARGFFQNILLRSENGVPAYHTAGFTDRWMGDMAWMVIAYLLYQTLYGFAGKPGYTKVKQGLMDLLKGFYRDSPEGGGYIRHGWRWGPLDLRLKVDQMMSDSMSVSDIVARYRINPKNASTALSELLACAGNDDHLHEEAYGGHQEGNIDCYSIFLHEGKTDISRNLAIWLEREIGNMEKNGWNLALDLVSWRVPAFGRERPDMFNKLYVIENDERFRKTLTFAGKEVTGFFHGPSETVNNIWCDGVGHMACAFYHAGDTGKGNFYSNQMDKLIIRRTLNGRETHAIPYTCNHSGGYGWVDTGKGFISVSAWYLFAKHQFNPLDLR